MSFAAMGGGGKHHGEPHHTLKKTISKTGLALKRVNGKNASHPAISSLFKD